MLDDDYLVLPEIVYALRARIAKTSPSGIFLQPPDEMLASTLSRITVDHRVHTSFNWLGYGSIIPRSEARGFLEATRALNLTEEEVKMADNYFSVLRNTFPENWFDQNTPLGGGQAFTVGQEGTERNNHHIRRAGELLDSVVLCEGESCTFPNNVEDPFARSEPPAETLTSVTPCVGAACVLTTSVQLLNSTPDMRVQSARSMLDNQARNIESLAQEERDFYLKHPPSQAVDGKLETGFCRNGAKKGESLALEVLHGAPLHWKHLEIAMLVDQGAQAMIRKGSFHLLAGAKSSLLHGSPEAKKAGEAEVLQHSRLVGRGKYVHEFEIHRVKPDRRKEEKYYMGLVKDERLHVKLTGSWESEVGEKDSIFHILEYENYGGYDKTCELIKNSEHLKSYEAMLPFLNSRSSQLNQEFAFFPTAPPHSQGGIFELRTYQLVPGTLLEWENAW
ncbi:hypothetical protein AAF712_004295 [Marasmius tenuissimus]|uniref:Uncharacterized protein n=1 Tax=Marasmius tenuissimus TaxID=585030 RepID=A0ABR3A3N2_9AGAR